MACHLLMPSHCLNQCLFIVNWTLRNKLQWNFNQNSYFFIQGNAFQNIVFETVAILSQSQCVKWIHVIHLALFFGGAFTGAVVHMNDLISLKWPWRIWVKPPQCQTTTKAQTVLKILGVRCTAKPQVQEILILATALFLKVYFVHVYDYNDFVQDCNNSSVLAMELLQSCIKPLICYSKCSFLYCLELYCWHFIFIVVVAHL